MATSAEIAAEIETATEDAVSLAESCSEGEWAIVVPGEGWPVGVVLHHIAVGHDLALGWVTSGASGEPAEGSVEDINAANDRHAEESAGVSVAATVELLRANGGRLAAAVAALDDDQLEPEVPFGPAGGKPFTLASLCELGARHAGGHTESVRAALGRS